MVRKKLRRGFTLLVIVLGVCLALFGCGGTTDTQAPESFVVSDLDVSAAEVFSGEEVSIAAEVENTGDDEGSYVATLKINGAEAATEMVTVAAGAKETVEFTVTEDVPGIYQIELDGLSATFEVVAPPLEAAEVSLTSNRAITDFPDTIAFMLEGSSVLPVATITLEYGTSKRSLVSEVSRVEPEYAPGVTIRASWTWEMKKTGSLPPGAEVWWQWRITDEEERVYVTPRQTMVWEDTRYQWEVESTQSLDIYWHGLGSSLVEELTEGVESRLSRVELEVEIPADRKPKVIVYPSSEELRSAVLFAQEWTGALAYPDYNIILIPIEPDDLEWAQRTLAHEITHLLVREAVFGPFGDIPTWLNEGLAQYAEGEMEEYQYDILESAIEEDELISVKSLGSSFPTDPEQARLAYAQSLSLVIYLVDSYGWADIRELLAVFKEGSTYDNALYEVYSFDIDGLEEQWLAYVGAN